MPKSPYEGGRAPEDIPPKLPPARSNTRRAQQLSRLAYDLLEERIRLGTASPTELVAAARLGSEIELANIARVKEHTEYLKAQKEKAKSETVRQEMFEAAMEAFKRYSPTQD